MVLGFGGFGRGGLCLRVRIFGYALVVIPDVVCFGFIRWLCFGYDVLVDSVFVHC